LAQRKCLNHKSTETKEGLCFFVENVCIQYHYKQVMEDIDKELTMNQKKVEAPIFNALTQFKEQTCARFHVPGHKGGVFFSTRAKPMFASILDIDVTELSGLDDLHDPQEMIREAQELAATCFNADQTYFLVNGSTVGNLAMILATLQKGDQVIVQRNSHKSIFHALALAEVEAVFLQPIMSPQFGVPFGVSLDQVQEGFIQYPQVKAVVLTYPNYYGMASAIKEVIQYTHDQGAIVLVDEAHGAHFGQHAALPPSAMQLGADISVQSTHKMLGSMTMSSMLHVRGSRVDQRDLQFFLRSLQSSSPSYPLLASLDLAREQLQRMDVAEWKRALSEYEGLREQISSTKMYHVSQPIKEGNYSLKIQMLETHMDPFKLIIQPSWGMSGYRLQSLLEDAGIYLELADPQNVLLTLPLYAQQEWNRRLADELWRIAKRYGPIVDEEKNEIVSSHSQLSKQDSPPTNIQMKIYKSSEMKEVPLHQAGGERATEMITPYPPGIPILIPGEEITQNIINYIYSLQHSGAYFQGKGKNKFNTILVAQ
jgi:arginine decarboxylase